MLGYFVRRLLLAAVTVWAITVVTFVIIQLPPGDFVDAYVAQSAAMGSAITMEEAAALRQAYGLDEPLLVQYVKWVGLDRARRVRRLVRVRPAGERGDRRSPLAHHSHLDPGHRRHLGDRAADRDLFRGPPILVG